MADLLLAEQATHYLFRGNQVHETLLVTSTSNEVNVFLRAAIPGGAASMFNVLHCYTADHESYSVTMQHPQDDSIPHTQEAHQAQVVKSLGSMTEVISAVSARQQEDGKEATGVISFLLSSLTDLHQNLQDGTM